MEYFFSEKEYQLQNGGFIQFFERKNFYIAYAIENEMAYAPYKTSFGVIEGENSEVFFQEFLEEIKQKAKAVQWVLPPELYPKSKALFAFLQKFGFEIAKVEVNQFLDLNQDFEENLHYSKRKKLKQQKEENFVFKQLDLAYFDQIFEIIRENRKSRNFPLTMKKEDLKKLALSFPENYLLFGTFINGILAACSVTIVLSKTVIYQFYWAHDKSFADKTPLLFHNYQLACMAKEKGFNLLDFGVSSVNGTINRGLFRFKKQLGAKTCRKYYLNFRF